PVGCGARLRGPREADPGRVGGVRAGPPRLERVPVHRLNPPTLHHSAGCSWLTQCTAPRPHTMSKQSMPTTLRPGNCSRSVPSAASSRGGRQPRIAQTLQVERREVVVVATRGYNWANAFHWYKDAEEQA